LPPTTVFENIKLPLLYSGGKYNANVVKSAIEAVDLTARRNHLPNQLLDGE